MLLIYTSPGTPTSGAINDDTSSSPVVNTIFSFVDHTKSREIATSQNTETALAELYAQVKVNNIASLSCKETVAFSNL